jgi:hypothetical protein
LSRQIPSTRLAAEFVVIVVGVLVALAADAWWESRSEARQRAVLLEALSDDFAVAERRLGAVRRIHTSVTARSESVLDFGETGSVPAEYQDSLDLLIGGHFHRANYEPPTGAFETALASGRIDLLGDDRLVSELTQWSATVARLQGTEDRLADDFYERIYPYLAARLDLEDLDKGFAEFEEVPWDQGPAASYRLVADQEFLSLIYFHWVLGKNALGRVAQVEEALARVQAALAEALVQ